MTTSHDPVVIVSAARTPMGSFQGDFASLSAHDLGGAAIKAAVERAAEGSQFSAELVTEVLFGNCLMAGQGQAPARQAGLKVACPRVLVPLPCPRCVALACVPPCLRTTCWWPAHTMCWWLAVWKA